MDFARLRAIVEKFAAEADAQLVEKTGVLEDLIDYVATSVIDFIEEVEDKYNKAAATKDFTEGPVGGSAPTLDEKVEFILDWEKTYYGHNDEVKMARTREFLLGNEAIADNYYALYQAQPNGPVGE